MRPKNLFSIKKEFMNVGQMTITEAYKYLNPISQRYGLNLKKVEDFKFVRLILANRCG